MGCALLYNMVREKGKLGQRTRAAGKSTGGSNRKSETSIPNEKSDQIRPSLQQEPSLVGAKGEGEGGSEEKDTIGTVSTRNTSTAVEPNQEDRLMQVDPVITTSLEGQKKDTNLYPANIDMQDKEDAQTHAYEAMEEAVARSTFSACCHDEEWSVSRISFEHGKEAASPEHRNSTDEVCKSLIGLKGHTYSPMLQKQKKRKIVNASLDDDYRAGLTGSPQDGDETAIFDNKILEQINKLGLSISKMRNFGIENKNVHREIEQSAESACTTFKQLERTLKDSEQELNPLIAKVWPESVYTIQVEKCRITGAEVKGILAVVREFQNRKMRENRLAGGKKVNDMTYSDLLKNVKDGLSDQEVSKPVQAVRKTKGGDLPLRVHTPNGEDSTIKECIKRRVTNAEIRSPYKGPGCIIQSRGYCR
ncbi:hypothetical protein HHI36_010040 [Cryptolaemus montrouzieri]|uniref:Uncharacterized protein n=1 Tax=Cryptolaemus montrouzieri TaxID=559131 RepID=A0ABD2MHM3_9CUCU